MGDVISPARREAAFLRPAPLFRLRHHIRILHTYTDAIFAPADCNLNVTSWNDELLSYGEQPAVHLSIHLQFICPRMSARRDTTVPLDNMKNIQIRNKDLLTEKLNMIKFFLSQVANGYFRQTFLWLEAMRDTTSRDEK